jgi:CubicO group peptidase (beta-lactamase class C family)
MVARGGSRAPVVVTTVEGFTTPGFEPVADVLAHGATATVGGRERHADLGDGGGAFAAYAGGERVVDLWAGDAAEGEPWARDTRAVVMSATKGLSALCAHILVDRGLLDLDATVATYWPEFAAAGKQGTLVRQLLSHQAGAIAVPGADDLLAWDGRGWADTQGIAAAVAAGPPAWAPGTRHGYHGLTFGWLVGELVRRLTGLSLGTFFAAEVARPLGVDCRIGTPVDAQRGVARVMEWTTGTRGRPATARPLDPASWSGMAVLAGDHGHLFADEHGRARFADFMNTPAVLEAEIGAIGATASARGLARVYAELTTGDELVSPRSVRVVAAEQVCGPDAVMRVPTRWAVGYTREPPPPAEGFPRQHGPNDEAFGHMGAGGQVAFADPVEGVACAFVRNHLENQAVPVLGATLVDTFYRCLGATR